jgi:cellobiose phosphorylase
MNGDWNDTLDQIGPKGKGETVWGGFFLGYILKKISELLEIRNDQVVLDRYKTAYGKLGEVINEFCWDDEWYIRAFRDDGTPVGTAGHKQGRIFLNSQTWAVISGLATEQRGDKAMESCKKYLAKPNGIQICWPSYTEVEEDVGLISRCVPGKKENGAVFNHASSWYILAALLNGDADFAFDIYSRMIPLNIAARDIDRYEVEPYVYAEYVTSPDHPTEGQASHSWLTGTSVWMLRIGLDHILGIRPAIKGIVIDPNIPSAWKQFSLRRVFRGKTIFLSVSNPDGRNRGVKRLTVNNIESDSTLIDVSKYSESKIFVDVVLG